MKIGGKVAVVSGGASGIGRAAVLALAERAAKVAFAGVEEDGSAAFRRCDVTKTEDLGSTFDSAVEQFGRFDIAFNNAGISGEDLFADEPGQWERIIDIDLTAVIDATRLAVRKMRLTGNAGVIINTASLIGLWPMASAPVYAAAKAGVINFSRSLAYLAEESSIRVNAICPEIVDTPMALGLGEESLEELRTEGGILKPEDIASGVVELIEDDSRFGAVMTVTIRGGRDYATM
jgi:15-hydroxyprostaglandin dehydrogenase (NAD)